MKKTEPNLETPQEQLNSAVSECSKTLAFALAFIGVNSVESKHTIKCEDETYIISINARKLKRSFSAEGN